MHIVLKSSRAVGRKSFAHSKNFGRVKAAIERGCSRYGVKLILYSNNFNHLHLLVRFKSRAMYLRFIRTVCGELAMIATGAKKGANAAQKFFDARPFSRIIRGFKTFRVAYDYVRLNQLEAAGEISYQKNRLRDLDEQARSYFNSNRTRA